GMTVLRDHAVADDLRALRQVVGQYDQHGLADRARRDVARLAGGVDDTDHGRRDALVEVQLHHLRRLGQHAAIGRLRGDQGRMSPCGARDAKRRQQRGKAGKHARHRALYGFAISLRPGAGVLLPSPWPAWPSAGTSIQRLTPCSHSCTTGKYSVVSGFRPAVRKLEKTNSSKLSSASLPPLHTTSLTPSDSLLPCSSYSVAYLPLTISSVQPGFGIGLMPITPSGICTRSLIVADPAQPCGTANTAL